MKYEKLKTGEKRLLVGTWVLALALFVFALVWFQASKPVSVSFVDVGQGDACLIQAGHRGNVLIDGGDGGSGVTLMSYFANQNVRALDAVFVSHFHEDHISGIMELIAQDFPIKMLYLPEVSDASQEEENFLKLVHEKQIPMRRISVSEELTIGKARYCILWPEDKAEHLTANNQSLVLRVDYGENRFLFTGDIEASAQAELVQEKKGQLSAQVLKVPHHGGESAVYRPFLEACHPQYAVIEVGMNNYYGHPSQKMLDGLTACGSTVYRTDLHGAVKLLVDKEKIKRIEIADKWRTLK
ncbi:MAG: ComEC/Rec2 family competence protein [Clostridia bacterium]|nr:ComEC/Rec2 family competence protein [Clostridia bacterium]